MTRQLPMFPGIDELRRQLQAEYEQKRLDYHDIREIERAEKELAQCDKCNGEKCHKSDNVYLKPVIDNLNGHYHPCYMQCKVAALVSMRKKFKRAAIPTKYANKTFNDYEITADNESAVRGAKWFTAKSPTKGLYLYGDTGTGKTFLAALIAREYILSFKSVIFGDVPALLADLKATFDSGGTEQLLDCYCNCDLLILDDLGAGQMTDWSVGTIYQIVNSRYSAEKSIVVTSNYDLSGLEEILSRKGDIAGKRIVSRLREITFQCFLGTKDRRL